MQTGLLVFSFRSPPGTLSKGSGTYTEMLTPLRTGTLHASKCLGTPSGHMAFPQLGMPTLFYCLILAFN